VGRAAGLVLVVALAVACAARGARTVAVVDRPPVPRLLGVYTAWAGTLPAADGLAVGSLSGLAYDVMSGRWVVASDEIRAPRLVWFDVALGPALGIVPSGVTRIALAPGVPADTLTALDMEGLVAFPDGSFAVSHEGHIDRQGVARQPRVLLVTRDGVVTEVLRPRPHFTIDPAERTRGVRHNLGFESLTRTPDGRLLVANEQPLAQDGPISDTGAGGLVRIAEFVRGADRRWAPGREWPYRLEPTPVVAGYDRACEDGQNGVSSFVALSDSTLLAVERACLLGAEGAPAYNPVRLYALTLTGGGPAGVAQHRVEHRGRRARSAGPEGRAHGDARERRQLPRHADHRLHLARPGVKGLQRPGVRPLTKRVWGLTPRSRAGPRRYNCRR
jgi:Esterase-like activity of phytase